MAPAATRGRANRTGSSGAVATKRLTSWPGAGAAAATSFRRARDAASRNSRRCSSSDAHLRSASVGKLPSDDSRSRRRGVGVTPPGPPAGIAPVGRGPLGYGGVEESDRGGHAGKFALEASRDDHGVPGPTSSRPNRAHRHHLVVGRPGNGDPRVRVEVRPLDQSQLIGDPPTGIVRGPLTHGHQERRHGIEGASLGHRRGRRRGFPVGIRHETAQERDPGFVDQCGGVRRSQPGGHRIPECDELGDPRMIGQVGLAKGRAAHELPQLDRPEVDRRRHQKAFQGGLVPAGPGEEIGERPHRWFGGGRPGGRPDRDAVASQSPADALGPLALAAHQHRHIGPRDTLIVGLLEHPGNRIRLRRGVSTPQQ